tara:strand:+ start:53 stop:388 length:336 start_codon:yes stop_codon:yes gene_type:complete
MCEKIREGKQMSLFLNDGDDIIEDSVVDDTIVKPSKRKRRSKADKYCSTCNQNITDLKKRDCLKFKNTYHQIMAKDYCKEHETQYSTHKCKPHWCGDCSYLIKYDIEVQTG